MYLELANISAAPYKMLLSVVYNLCICFLHDETKQRHTHEKHTGTKLSELNNSSKISLLDLNAQHLQKNLD